MAHENDANYCVIRKVFGMEFAASKVVSCQKYYTRSVIVTETFLKSFVMKCVLLLLLASTMTKQNGWRRLQIYSQRLVHG